VKTLLEGHFESTYLYEWASKLGKAAIIGVVGYFFDKIPITEYDFEISQSTDDLPFTEPKPGITKVTIDGITAEGTPFIGTRAGSYSTFKKSLKIPHGAALKVESYSTAYKTLTDSEMVMPTTNLALIAPSVGLNIGILNARTCWLRWACVQLPGGGSHNQARHGVTRGSHGVSRRRCRSSPSDSIPIAGFPRPASDVAPRGCLLRETPRQLRVTPRRP
jgi:hypothetical protein